jgi:molybdopterin synthase sulfur carrier subunit
MIKLLYFAWLRSKIGLAEETLALPTDVKDVAGLVALLKARGGGYADALSDLTVVKVAVNQEYVPFTQPVQAGDEVALFPPVTGG